MNFIKDALQSVLGSCSTQIQVAETGEYYICYDIEYICSFIILCLFLVGVFKVLGWLMKDVK